VYEGGWRGGERNGKCTYKYYYGATYEGECANDKMHGKGTYKCANGVYEGEWKDGEEHGKGTFKCSISGRIFSGEWKDGMPHGHFVITYKDGSVYEGGWRDGKRFSSGGTYEG